VKEQGQVRLTDAIDPQFDEIRLGQSPREQAQGLLIRFGHDGYADHGFSDSPG
jgi:hypothetical protein